SRSACTASAGGFTPPERAAFASVAVGVQGGAQADSLRRSARPSRASRWACRAKRRRIHSAGAKPLGGVGGRQPPYVHEGPPRGGPSRSNQVISRVPFPDGIAPAGAAVIPLGRASPRAS